MSTWRAQSHEYFYTTPARRIDTAFPFDIHELQFLFSYGWKQIALPEQRGGGLPGMPMATSRRRIRKNPFPTLIASEKCQGTGNSCRLNLHAGTKSGNIYGKTARMLQRRKCAVQLILKLWGRDRLGSVARRRPVPIRFSFFLFLLSLSQAPLPLLLPAPLFSVDSRMGLSYKAVFVPEKKHHRNRAL